MLVPVSLSEISILAAAVGGACGVILVLLGIFMVARHCRRKHAENDIELHSREQEWKDTGMWWGPEMKLVSSSSSWAGVESDWLLGSNLMEKKKKKKKEEGLEGIFSSMFAPPKKTLSSYPVITSALRNNGSAFKVLFTLFIWFYSDSHHNREVLNCRIGVVNMEVIFKNQLFSLLIFSSQQYFMATAFSTLQGLNKTKISASYCCCEVSRSFSIRCS